MKMEHYLSHTDYPIWKVIHNGNGLVSVTIDTNGKIKVLPPKTTEEVMVRERERKARTTLLRALPEDHLAKFHKMADAKEMWEAIKSRFGGNDESKKKHKYLMKQQFEGFLVYASEGLHKRYDRFQTLLSQLEIHGVGVSHEDANQKFLRSLPYSWSQVALIMRTKPGLDTLSFDDLYNNLRVFERTTASSSSNTQNVAFVSADNTSNTNDINDDDLEEIDLKWQVAMISMMIKKFHKRTDNRRRDGGYNGNKAKDIGRRPAYHDDSKALVTIDGEDIDWSRHVEEDTQNFAMMAYSSSNSGSDYEVLTMRLGYGDYRYGSILSYENEVLQIVFMNKECDLENTPVNDRYAKGMHAVPPPMTGNYIPSRRDVEIDYSKFTYGLKQTSIDELDAQTSENATCESDSSVETTTSMPALIDNAPKIVYKPKVWTDAPIIEKYELDYDDDLVSNVQENIEKPSFAFIDSVTHVKSPRENVKETGTPNHCPKIEKQDRHSHTRKGFGYAFTRKSCFVCGSFSHLIRDCDFHEKRMAKQAKLATCRNKVTGQKEHRPVWNNVKRVNHQNKFVLSVLLTKTGKFPVNAARQHFSSQTASTCTARKFNTARPIVNETRPKRCFNKSHSPNKMPFHNKTAHRNTYLNHKVNNVNTSLSAVKGNGDTVVKASAGCNWRIKRNSWNKVFKYNSGSKIRKSVKDPLGRLESEMASGTKLTLQIIKNLRPLFDGKSDLRFLIRYSLNSKAFRVYDLETKRVEENLHVNFLENKPNVVGKGHAWMFDLDYLTNSMNYEPVSVENQANKSTSPKEANNSAGTEANNDQGENSKEINLHDEHFVLPIWSAYSTTIKSSGDTIQKTTDCKTCEKLVSQVKQIFQEELEKLKRQEKEANNAVRKEATHDTQDANTNSTNLLNVVSAPVSAVGLSRALNDDEPSYPDDPSMPHLEDIYASPSEGIFTDLSYDDEGVVTDFNNLETTMNVSPTSTTRIHTIHLKTQILGDPLSAVQTRSKVHKNSEDHC
nr:ribonuclease H-like domain-containing protein [Tanacetum cinerariifolium]